MPEAVPPNDATDSATDATESTTPAKVPEPAPGAFAPYRSRRGQAIHKGLVIGNFVLFSILFSAWGGLPDYHGEGIAEGRYVLSTHGVETEVSALVFYWMTVHSGITLLLILSSIALIPPIDLAARPSAGRSSDSRSRGDADGPSARVSDGGGVRRSRR